MITLENFRSSLLDSGAFSRDGRSPAPRCFVSLRYHCAFARHIVRGGKAARRATSDEAAYREAHQTSVDMFGNVLDFGGGVDVSHFDRARGALGKPAVYVANHLSPLETYLLPGVLFCFGNISVVVKTALLKLPYLSDILRASRPIALERQEPKKDLLQVLEQGAALLREGRGILLFPEGTRRAEFDPRRFNTLGEKLSSRAGVPLVPLAVDTRFQALGKGAFRDFGSIRPCFTVRIECGEPVPPGLPAKERHAQCVSFIKERLLEWGVPTADDAVRLEGGCPQPPHARHTRHANTSAARGDTRPPGTITREQDAPATIREQDAPATQDPP